MPVVVFVERLGRVLDGCRRHLSGEWVSTSPARRVHGLKSDPDRSELVKSSLRPKTRIAAGCRSKTVPLKQRRTRGLSVAIELAPRGRAVCCVLRASKGTTNIVYTYYYSVFLCVLLNQFYVYSLFN